MELITLKNVNNLKLIQGVIVRPLKINKDKSGTLVETLRSDWQEVYGKGRKFFMQYYSTIPPNVAKDEHAWHYHNHQEDRIVIVSGAIILAVADNRKRSSSYGEMNIFLMTPDNPYMIIIPKKTLHGLLAVSKEKAIVLNFPTALYNLQDNISIPFNSTTVKLPDGTFFSWGKIKKFFKEENKTL